ncbi:MAG: DUF3782 domain-containing protein [Thermoprotei archaeon]
MSEEMSAGSQHDLKKQLLSLLETDEELRRKIFELIVPKELAALTSELSKLRKDMLDQFRSVNKHLELLDERFLTMDKRFEAMNERFEAVDRRFEAINQRFEAMDKRFEAMIGELRSLRIEVSALGGRLGFGFEDLVRQTIRSFSDADIKSVERIELYDDLGEVFGRPAKIEFDAYASNGDKFLVEVKSSAKVEDVLLFARKAAWAERKIGRAKLVLVTAYIDSDAYKECSRLGIRCVARNIVPVEEPGGVNESSRAPRAE